MTKGDRRGERDNIEGSDLCSWLISRRRLNSLRLPLSPDHHRKQYSMAPTPLHYELPGSQPIIVPSNCISTLRITQISHQNGRGSYNCFRLLRNAQAKGERGVIEGSDLRYWLASKRNLKSLRSEPSYHPNIEDPDRTYNGEFASTWNHDSYMGRQQYHLQDRLELKGRSSHVNYEISPWEQKSRNHDSLRFRRPHKDFNGDDGAYFNLNYCNKTSGKALRCKDFREQ